MAGVQDPSRVRWTSRRERGSGAVRGASVPTSRRRWTYCDTCMFNFYTGEGNPPCEDLFSCEHGAEPLEHVKNVRAWRAG